MFLNLYIITALCGLVHGYELKQVIVLSRHGVRAPLSFDLELYTQKHWPEWNIEAGYLTQRGSVIERSMGKYFSDWLVEEKLLSYNCSGDDAFVYANTYQRTMETAKAFVDGFRGCASVHYKITSETDPIFDAVVRNSSKEFEDLVVNETQRKLDEIDLARSFVELERILDFKNSSYCEGVDDCALGKVKNVIVYFNSMLDMVGPLKFGTWIVDSFLMAYYNGREPKDVAWGEINTTEKWETLLKIIISCIDVLFGTPILAEDIAKSLLEYMRNIFLTGGKKFYMIVGHDTNIASVMSALTFKRYNLHDQIEIIPIGGKVVFQKWYNALSDQHLLRVDYVYQSTQQIRDGAVPSLQNPPHWAPLELAGCAVDENGFCRWIDFLKILNSL